jgi:hypothetical protein
MVELASIPRDASDFEMPSLSQNVGALSNERYADMIADMPRVLENPELTRLMSSKPVVLQGMLFSLHFAGDDLLKAQITGLGERDFNKLKNQVEDLMQTIDKSHASREHCYAASWEAAGTKTTGGETDYVERSRSLKLRMFPRKFSNQLAVVKENLVYQRLRNCISIETYSSGRYKQMLYILPYSNAAKMMTLVAEANKEIDTVNRELITYVQSSDYAELLAILDEYPQAKRDIQGRHWHIPQIRFEVMPLQLDTGAVMEMVEQVDIKDLKLKAEYDRGIKLLQQELDAKSRDMTTKVLGALKKEIDTYVGNVIAEMKLNPENIKADMAALKNKAASMGLGALAETVIAPLEIVLTDKTKAYNTFGITSMSDLQGEVDERILAVLQDV